jgi:hypothetical protein
VAESFSLARQRAFPVGRMFLSVPFDYLAIGGGLSLVTVGVLGWTGYLQPSGEMRLPMGILFLLLNAAHFAASTVRLYTKPGAFRFWPLLTMGVPLVAIAALTAGVLLPEHVGRNLFVLYLTWSPFHYAAQAFGLACMYHYRSGGTLDAVERRLVYWTCMLPFLHNFVGGSTTGLGWFAPPAVMLQYPSLQLLIIRLTSVFEILTFVAPLIVGARLLLRGRQGLPLISWLIIFTNGIWWITLTYLQAFVWATVFHGLQYLAIVTIFHVKEQTALPDNRHSPRYHALWFYGACVVLAYLLFQVWPYAYVFAGSGMAEAVLTSVAVINIHHFVVDRYIWRLRKDPNYEIVVASSAPASSAPSTPQAA